MATNASKKSKKMDWKDGLGVAAAVITVVGGAYGLYQFTKTQQEKKKEKAALNGANMYYSLPEYNQETEYYPNWEDLGQGDGLNMYENMGVPVADIG